MLYSVLNKTIIYKMHPTLEFTLLSVLSSICENSVFLLRKLHPSSTIIGVIAMPYTPHYEVQLATLSARHEKRPDAAYPFPHCKSL